MRCFFVVDFVVGVRGWDVPPGEVMGDLEEVVLWHLGVVVYVEDAP